MHVSAVRRYPVKSMRGEDLDESTVEPWGLAGDRRWMVTDESGGVITAREVNSMLLLHPVITASGLRIEADGRAALEVATPDPGDQQPVSIWSSDLTAAFADPAADAWLSEAMGRPVRLSYLDDPRRRQTDARFSRGGDVVSFADGYPVLVTTEESLAVLNDALTERSGDPRDALPMVRFRPNVVVAGDDDDLAAWVEDDWRRLRIGGPDGVELRLVKGCARCVITTIDTETGRRSKEPTATLARLRRFDGGVWFGVNAIPDGVGPTSVVRIGDPVEVLESVPPGEGPIRSRDGGPTQGPRRSTRS